MIISLIAAIARNRVIGKDNALPWKLPADMRRFKQLTIGKPIIMGRKTFESIGRPLPDRMNVIITRNKDFHAEGCTVVHSLDEVITSVGEAQEVMVIGGSSVFQQFLPYAKRMYLTIIDEDIEGDVLFPEFDINEWHEQERIEYQPDEKNAYRYVFVTLEKK
mgnify:FL=1